MVPSFEDFLKKIGGGKFQILMFLSCSSWGLIASMHLMIAVFLVPQSSNFECQIQLQRDLNWTHEQKYNLTEFWTEEELAPKCFYYQANYSEDSPSGVSDSALRLSPQGVTKHPCTSWFYDSYPLNSTVTSEWDLVCDRRYLRSLVQTVFMAGALISALMGGYLADKLGRLSLIRIGFPFYVISGFLGAFAPTFQIFLLSRFLLAMSGNFVYLTSYILLLEWCLPRRRSIYGIVFSVPFCLGYMALPILASTLGNWRLLLKVISGFSCFFIFNFLVMKESPRWLLLHGKMEEAVKAMNDVCRMNGQRCFDAQDLKNEFSEIASRMNPNHKYEKYYGGATKKKIFPITCCHSSKEQNSPRSSPIKEREQQQEQGQDQEHKLEQEQFHVTSRNLPKFCFILTFLWFSSNFVYYGLSLNAGNFGVNIFVYMFLGGLMEIPCYTVIMPFVIKYGRRIPLFAFFSICGLCIITTIFIPKDDLYSASIVLTMFGKLNITSAFQLLYLYSSEVFPTTLRTRGVGITSMVGRLGSILAPIMIDIIGPLNWRLPLVAFGIISLIAGFLTLGLPETKKKSLPETSHDLDNLNRVERSSSS